MAYLKDVVECWHWLLSACPCQELVFLQEMISAWHHTRFARLGLFTDDTKSEQVYLPIFDARVKLFFLTYTKISAFDAIRIL